MTLNKKRRQQYLHFRLKKECPAQFNPDWIWDTSIVESDNEIPILDDVPITQLLPHLLDMPFPKSARNSRRLMGAHYTPLSTVRLVLQGCEYAQTTKLCDPAMGAGIWLIEWLKGWCKKNKAPLSSGLNLIYGVDVDPMSVSITRYLLWELCGFDPQVKSIIVEHIICRDACLMEPKDVWPEVKDGFDLILGNPPWLFLSGKRSPVSELRKSGASLEAEEYKHWICQVSARYPEVSKGCKDLYKWFVGLGLQWLLPDGRLRFILPASFIFLPRYRDLRSCLSSSGRVRVYQLPDVGFKVVAPTCILMVDKGEADKSIEYIDKREGISRVQTIIIQGDEWPIYRSKWTESLYMEKGPRLGDWLEIREGVHQLNFESGTLDILAVDHREIGAIKVLPTRKGFLKSALKGYRIHEGPRLVIRKTGDHIVAGIVGTPDRAIAHQNVYVAKPKANCPLSLEGVYHLLNDPLLTKVYQESPLGQPNRVLAQLRVVALRKLPIPPELINRLKLNKGLMALK